MTKQSLKQWLVDGRYRFVIFCAYYVLVTYVIPSQGVVQQYSPQYFALILPGWLYIVFSWRVLIQSCDALVRLWWLFALTSLVVGAIQGSASLAYNGIYLSLLAIVIINSGGYLKTCELNLLFLICIFGSIAIYLFGITDYGILPGQAVGPSCHKAMTFRVSLFRVLSESAALSLFVLIWNIFRPPNGPHWLRWMFITLALYFLVLSGIRSAILGLLVASPVILYQFIQMRNSILRGALSVILPLGLVVILLIQMTQTGGASNLREFLSNLVFRNSTCAAQVSRQETASAPTATESTTREGLTESFYQSLNNKDLSLDWLQETFNRHCPALYQLKLFIKHPMMGNALVHPSSDVQLAELGCSKADINNYCEACVVATYWLSRGGLAGMLLIGIYLIVLLRAFQVGNRLGIATLITFGILLQGWGVMFTPYNFTFYMLASLIPHMTKDGFIRASLYK